MTSADSMFSVLVNGNQLVVTQLTHGVKRTLCLLDLRQQPSFYLDNGAVVCRDSQGREFTLDAGDGVADDLLAQLVTVQLPQGNRVQQYTTKLLVAALLISAGVLGGMKVPDLLENGSRPVTSLTSTPPLIVAPQAQAKSAQAGTTKVASADNGWTLPTSARATLPEKLHNAAERKLFTVDYSSGHDRTLYVFADPGCPNCQRVEPSLQAAASAFNVVVFPVAVIGKEQSIAAITPVLCLPPEQRRAAWAALFDLGHDGLSLGQKPVSDEFGSEASACDMANKALGVNEMAYQAYRIPGTPWVIADDGRYVPQALLGNPAKLQAFLNSKEATDAPE